MNRRYCLLFALLLLTQPLAATSATPRSPALPALRPTAVVSVNPADSRSPEGLPPALPLPFQSSSSTYDEQLGITFTQSFTSLLYNVTAVAQSDPNSGAGPAYLLNGLSNSGYWYQVGLSWNWDVGNTPGSGFDMNYQVFDNSKDVVAPSQGGGGLLAFNGSVNQGDSVALNMYLSGNQVVMLAEDRNTGASAEFTYSAEGATRFVGLPASTGNSNGFFTGLMTEWYRPNAYYGSEESVTYSTALAISSAWMWIDEFGCANSNCTSTSPVFFDHTSGPVVYSSPSQPVYLSSHGATEYSDPYSFTTGNLSASSSLISLTLSFTVQGGGAGYSSPSISYMQNGESQKGEVSASGTTFYLDQGSNWTVSQLLPGSSDEERWACQLAGGTAVAGGADLTLAYYHQFYVNLTVDVVGGGTGPGNSRTLVNLMQFGTPLFVAAGTGVWADAGSVATFPALLPGSGPAERWAAAETGYPVSGPGNASVVYQHQFYFDVAATPSGGGTVSPPPGWVDSGETVTIGATAAKGWRFGLWLGSGGGVPSNGSEESFEVTGPVNQTAVFYPGVTIDVNGVGTVLYSYSGGNGSVTKTQTIYVPVGSNLSLDASPPPLFAFAGWEGAIVASSADRTIQLVEPVSVTADFVLNYRLIGVVVVAIILAAAGGALLLTRRRRAEPQYRTKTPDAATSDPLRI